MVISYVNGILQGSSPEEVPSEPILETHEDAEEVDEKTTLKEMLTEAGIEFDGRAGIAKLRELAGQVK